MDAAGCRLDGRALRILADRPVAQLVSVLSTWLLFTQDLDGKLNEPEIRIAILYSSVVPTPRDCNHERNKYRARNLCGHLQLVPYVLWLRCLIIVLRHS